MRIVFIGAVNFSFNALKKLINMKANVVGVCTKSHSSFNSDFCDLSVLCDEIPYLYVENINKPEVVEWIKEKSPDVIFCFGWSSLIGKEILELSPLGVVGYHPANLPENRGRHPLIWSIVLGLETGGSTFFIMDDGADSGDVLSQAVFNIAYEDDANDVYKKMTKAALKQLETIVPQMESGLFNRVSQDDSKSNVWRRRSIKDGEIDFRMTSRDIYNLVRGLTRPYVGAHIIYEDDMYKVWRVEEVIFDAVNIEPGKVLDVDGECIVVKCSGGAIRLIEHDIENIPEVGSYI